MRGLERASSSSALRAYLHTASRKRVIQPEPKSDKERAKLGLPLREPWFEVKPFDEKKKNLVLRLKEILQAQPRQKIEIASLGQLRQELDVVRQGKQRKIATYVRLFPAAFSLRSFFTPNNKKKTWCSFSADALKLLEEEDLLFQASEALHVQKLRKLLMISMKNRLPFSSVNQVRESLGLPFDFKDTLVNKHPDVFFLNERKGCIYLELKHWDDALAISALEKNAQEAEGCTSKTSKKRKKHREERAIAEGEGNEQEASYRRDHEQSGEENEEMILTNEGEGEEQVDSAEEGEGEGEAHEEETYDEEEVSSAREVEALEEEARSEQSSSLKEKVNSTEYVEAHLEEVHVSRGIGNVYNCTDSSEEQHQSYKGMHQNSSCLHFLWKNKRGKQPNSKHAAEIVAFHSAPYTSPYKNSRDLELPANSMAMEKFVVAVLHEFLSLTLEKRATLQQLELFQRPFRLPGNLLQFLRKYDGIFYVVVGKTKSHVFLKEAYKESILLEKEPLVLWQERFVELAFSTLKKSEKSKPSNGSSPQQDQALRNEVQS